MADAALGGKTAVNLPTGKNLVGSFHQPWGVYADVSVLGTQPATHFRDGFAEVVKSAVIADATLFRRLEQSVDALLERSAEALEATVAACMRIKGRIVSRDEREAGRRAALNFGHTVGHGLEAASRYRMRHGRALAIGLAVESRLAEEATGFPPMAATRVLRLLEAFGLSTQISPRRGIDPVVQATRQDKKNRAGRVRYALPTRLGGMLPGDDVTVEVSETALRAALRARQR
jgi:3-dehydroquinate synthase